MARPHTRPARIPASFPFPSRPPFEEVDRVGAKVDEAVVDEALDHPLQRDQGHAVRRELAIDAHVDLARRHARRGLRAARAVAAIGRVRQWLLLTDHCQARIREPRGHRCPCCLQQRLARVLQRAGAKRRERARDGESGREASRTCEYPSTAHDATPLHAPETTRCRAPSWTARGKRARAISTAQSCAGVMDVIKACQMRAESAGERLYCSRFEFISSTDLCGASVAMSRE